jgi:hypothetical protein
MAYPPGLYETIHQMTPAQAQPPETARLLDSGPWRFEVKGDTHVRPDAPSV